MRSRRCTFGFFSYDFLECLPRRNSIEIRMKWTVTVSRPISVSFFFFRLFFLFMFVCCRHKLNICKNLWQHIRDFFSFDFCTVSVFAHNSNSNVLLAFVFFSTKYTTKKSTTAQLKIVRNTYKPFVIHWNGLSLFRSAFSCTKTEWIKKSTKKKKKINIFLFPSDEFCENWAKQTSEWQTQPNTKQWFLALLGLCWLVTAIWRRHYSLVMMHSVVSHIANISLVLSDVLHHQKRRIVNTKANCLPLRRRKIVRIEKFNGKICSIESDTNTNAKKNAPLQIKFANRYVITY